MGNGWITIHRSLLKKGYYNDSHYVHLWLHLLLRANHETTEFLWNNEILKIQRGQFVTGRKKMAKETGIQESKIERILKCFESEQQIEQQKTTKYRLITILNYSEYQDKKQQSEQQVNNKRTTSEHKQQLNKDNNETKNTDTGEHSSRVKQSFNPLGAEIIKAFEAIDPKNKNYYGNTTQRKACDYLISEYSLEKVLKFISLLPSIRGKSYYPSIHSPWDLQEKWERVVDAYQREKADITKSASSVAF